MSTPPSRPNHLPKTSLPNTVTLGIKLQHMNLWGHKYSVHSGQWGSRKHGKIHPGKGWHWTSSPGAKRYKNGWGEGLENAEGAKHLNKQFSSAYPELTTLFARLVGWVIQDRELVSFYVKAVRDRTGSLSSSAEPARCTRKKWLPGHSLPLSTRGK